MAWIATNALLREGRSWSGRERNCCYLNTGDGRFADVSAVSGLDFADDARAVATVDWDQDGDLDLWISNRTAPRLRFLRNDSPAGGRFVAVRLIGVDCNRDAIGARVELHLGGGLPKKLIKTVRAGESFLSQSSKWVHFGIGDATRVERLVVRWPHGERQTFTDLAIGNRYEIRQHATAAERLTIAKRPIRLKPTSPRGAPPTEQARVVLVGRLPLPKLPCRAADGSVFTAGDTVDGPMLINLWATWCGPCLVELREFTAQRQRISNAGLHVLALNVDGPDESTRAGGSESRQVLDKLGFPFAGGEAEMEVVDKLAVIQRTLLDAKRPLPLPASLLVDRHGRIAVMYLGPVDVEQLLADVAALDTPWRNRRELATPFAGRWLSSPAATDPIQVAMTFFEGGYFDHAIEYLRLCVELRQGDDNFEPPLNPLPLHYFMATLYENKNETAAAIENYRQVVKIDPHHVDAHHNLGAALLKLGDSQQALVHLAETVRLNAEDARAWYDLGRAHYALGKAGEAAACYRRALALDPDWIAPANNLAWILATDPDPQNRNGAEAVELALRVCRRNEFSDFAALDTLAAAYAETGQFAKAVETAEQAIRLLQSAGRAADARPIRENLAKYRNEQPARFSPTMP